ncbi:siphovirus Gp157 family protein [Escherichia coli]|uniref:siphovirus Gp157 family protein n=1 Tax=Escherichia coli TaxID=562 RepID=UPI001F57EF0F|nr:siphovirus Gp157 family protein [Escherichia coli]MCI2234017.1 siphovirus Gp157 family protein [Escherichia coli]
MHLYEITKQLNDLLAMEDIPREQIEDTINLIEEEFEGKAEMVAAFIRELEADEAGMKAEIDRLSERKRVLSAKIDNLKDYLRQNMLASGKTNIKGKLFSIALGKPSPVLDVFIPVEQLPEQYIVVKKSADNAALKAALKAGTEIKGCAITDGKPKLIIK